ncbi:DUF5806 family protein [Candidatus Halobonum tyrrellensis]|uniref:Uncharacterized protein n=1 Tax=Candidatus Halobonum tyrrellensis G22 TaxID=1324957 RepID=V4IWF2_9EURY|nr:DUF5806 family protein [Candidatus Halobonum tyrrellensis]ESP87517.1 hypothetical protein K933_13631 [Candidatus Halobonum tyrrellensis G22]
MADDAGDDPATERTGETPDDATPADGEADAGAAGADGDETTATGASAAAEPSDGADAEAADDRSGADAASDGSPPGPDVGADAPGDVPRDVRKYDRFQKMDRAEYDRVNEFLRDRTYVTAREWAIARLCADFRTETGVEMTKIGENLPRLVPFMTDTYTPQAVNQARASFEEKVRKAGATFLYGAMCGFFTAEDLDDMMYEVTEVAKFLLEVEGVDLAVEEELAAEDRISTVMRDVREASAEVRGEEVKCPECGHVHEP